MHHVYQSRTLLSILFNTYQNERRAEAHDSILAARRVAKQEVPHALNCCHVLHILCEQHRHPAESKEVRVNVLRNQMCSD